MVLVLDNLEVLLEEHKVLDGCDLTWQRAVNCCASGDCHKYLAIAQQY